MFSYVIGMVAYIKDGYKPLRLFADATMGINFISTLVLLATKENFHFFFNFYKLISMKRIIQTGCELSIDFLKIVS